MNVKIISKVEDPHIRKDLPGFNVGDTLRVGLKVSDGKGGSRIQHFEGILIAVSGSGTRKTITVRKIGANGVAVEMIIPLHAKVLDTVEVTGQSRRRVRRAKLYYLRSRVGKAATNA